MRAKKTSWKKKEKMLKKNYLEVREKGKKDRK